jgi:hypothetical protein
MPLAVQLAVLGREALTGSHLPLSCKMAVTVLQLAPIAEEAAVGFESSFHSAPDFCGMCEEYC